MQKLTITPQLMASMQLINPADVWVLGIDQAATSGWCIYHSGRPLKWGVVTTNSGRADVVELAAEMTTGDPGLAPRCLVVFEDHSEMRVGGIRKNGRRVFNTSTATLLGLGAARGRWEALLDQAGHDDRARLMVTTKMFRQRVLGLRGNAPADEAKALAKLRYQIAEHDAAEACAIAEWGAKSPEGLTAWARAFGPKARKRRTGS